MNHTALDTVFVVPLSVNSRHAALAARPDQLAAIPPLRLNRPLQSGKQDVASVIDVFIVGALPLVACGIARYMRRGQRSRHSQRLLTSRATHVAAPEAEVYIDEREKEVYRVADEDEAEAEAEPAEEYPWFFKKLLEVPIHNPMITAALREFIVDPGNRELLIKFLLSPAAKIIKPTIVRELAKTLDLVMRSTTRRAYQDLNSLLSPTSFFGVATKSMPIPVITSRGAKLVTSEKLLNCVQPKLSDDEEMYFKSSAHVILGLLGIRTDSSGDLLTKISSQSIVESLAALASQSDADLQRVFSRLVSDRRGRGLLTEWWTDIAYDLRDTLGKRMDVLGDMPTR